MDAALAGENRARSSVQSLAIALPFSLLEPALAAAAAVRGKQ